MSYFTRGKQFPIFINKKQKQIIFIYLYIIPTATKRKACPSLILRAVYCDETFFSPFLLSVCVYVCVLSSISVKVNLCGNWQKVAEPNEACVQYH